MLSLFDNLSITRDASHSPLWQSPSFHHLFVFNLCGLGHCSTMALVDFHQLTIPYNLRRYDAEFLSKHSYPPMSTSVLSYSPSPRVHSSLPLPASSVSQTPRHRRVAATAVGLTPLSLGSSICQRQEGDIYQVDQYDGTEYEEHIRGELSCRVFVDYEVFMKRVLHVPDDWKTRWGPAIEAIKADAEFNEQHKNYCRLCEGNDTLEERLYPALTETENAILGVVSRSNFKDIPSGRRQYYYVSDPEHLKGGMMNKNRVLPQCEVNKMPHWENPLHVLELKPYGNTLCDGKNIPRLVVDGKHAIWPFLIWLQLI